VFDEGLPAALGPFQSPLEGAHAGLEGQSAESFEPGPRREGGGSRLAAGARRDRFDR